MVAKIKQTLADKARQVSKSVAHEIGETARHVTSQVSGSEVHPTEESPVVEAMQQTGPMSDAEKKRLRKHKFWVSEREAEEEKYRKLREQAGQQYTKKVEEEFQLLKPGEAVEQPLPQISSRPSRRIGAEKNKQPTIETRKGKQ